MSDRVTPAMREQVLERDAWVHWALIDPTTGKHEALDRESADYGRFMRWWDSRISAICMVGLLTDTLAFCKGPQTLEHVKDELRMGKRAPSDQQHMVACCWYHNVDKPPSKEARALLRDYLGRVER